jgi:hypothetical protein
MSTRSHRDLSSGKTWFLAIGQWLRTDYDAVEHPVPEHLTALLQQLQNREEKMDASASVPPRR